MAEYRAAPKNGPGSRRAPGAADPGQADDGRRAASQPPAAPARRLADAHRWTVRAFPRDSARAVARPLRARPRAGPRRRTAGCGAPVPRRDGTALLPRSGRRGADPVPRSEEHTSELQSLMRISYAV